MVTTGKNKWWQGSWTIPLSIMLHVLIGTTYLLWPGPTPAPAEPESVSVEMVEPPKEEPPKEEPPKPEEKKAEEPPPPPLPAEEKPQEQPPPPPPPSQMSSVAMRPEPTQMDERDDPGQQDAAGQEQPKPEPEPVKEADTPQPATPPSPEPAEAEATPKPSAAEATSEQGEIPAAETPVPEQEVAAVVPTPKPEIKPSAEQPAKVVPDGEGDPKLKPARKILAASKRPGPMMRQIFGNLPPRDRVMQLCFAEVVAQIKEAPQGGAPDGLQFLKRDLAGNVLDAKAAFNIGPQWFPIDYRCEVDIDKYIVTDFRYEIRPKLSSDEIRRLDLRAN
jgi:hypothetical protein